MHRAGIGPRLSAPTRQRNPHETPSLLHRLVQRVDARAGVFFLINDNFLLIGIW